MSMGAPVEVCAPGIESSGDPASPGGSVSEDFGLAHGMTGCAIDINASVPGCLPHVRHAGTADSGQRSGMRPTEDSSPMPTCQYPAVVGAAERSSTGTTIHESTSETGPVTGGIADSRVP